MAADIDAGKAARLKSPERWNRKANKICDAFGCRSPSVPRESYCTYHLKLLNRGTEAGSAG